jgi:hypothetical protein
MRRTIFEPEHESYREVVREFVITNDYLNAEAIRLDAGVRLGPRSR